MNALGGGGKKMSAAQTNANAQYAKKFRAGFKPHPNHVEATPPPEPSTKVPPRPNKWLAHVKAFRAAHPDLKFKEVLQQAKLTYSK